MGYKREKNNGNYGNKCCKRERNCVCEASNLQKLIKCFNESYEEYGEQVANALMFAKKSLDALKDASEANGQTLENGKNILAWIEKCGSKYRYNFDDCECEKIAEELQDILCEINEELSEAAKDLCNAIESISDVAELNCEFEEALQEYVECVQENDEESCEDDESSSEDSSSRGKKCGCNPKHDNSCNPKHGHNRRNK